MMRELRIPGRLCYIYYANREFITLAAATSIGMVCRGGAAEGWAARRWRAPFRSTSLRAEEPAANDAAGPKNGQAGKVVPGGHWAASGALISATNPRARKPWWLGGSLPNLATHGAIFARNRVPARNADHT